MENKIHVLNKSFYFVRHGQTDWNKNKSTQNVLCHADDIPLNATGVEQVNNTCSQIHVLNITKICSSPLKRAYQSAEIINEYLKVSLELHEGLGKIKKEIVAQTLNTILKSNEGSLLIVSHGEVYRVLLEILQAKTEHPNAQNAGLYYFKVDSLGNWIAESV